ncbi:MAG: TIGR04255 family protein [Cyanobacteria bacterium J06629_9]
MTLVDYNPLIAQSPEEVPLERAPLASVVAQVRFPSILAIGEDKKFIAAFQESIRSSYPILEPEQSRTVLIDAKGTPSISDQMIWRFVDSKGLWRVSLGTDFLSLETNEYLGRSVFLERLESILKDLEEHVKPSMNSRFGLRYINRINCENIEHISQFVRPEVAGIITSEFEKNVHQSISESIFLLPENQGRILTRWGLVSANTTIDPILVEPVDSRSWILDLDVSTSIRKEFDVEGLMSDAKRFSERIYTFFRWAVTEDFLKHFGGEI